VFSGVLGEDVILVSPRESVRLYLTASLPFRLQVPLHPAKAIFVAVDVLLLVVSYVLLCISPPH
jgi:hypothetical protein